MTRTALFAAALVGCIFVTDNATLTVHNHSSHGLVELRMAEVHDAYWGANLLGGMLPAGADIVLDGIACGHYDVMITDEHARTCVRSAMDLCGTDRSWVISDALLSTCY